MRYGSWRRKFGIIGKARDWFRSYLKGRTLTAVKVQFEK